MYQESDKRRIYWLLEQYLQNRIDETTFCDEFYFSYDLGINKEVLNVLERQVFWELSHVASRFSQYEEDHKLDPHAFTTKEELKEKIIEIYEKLKQQSPD
jgi:hypothetical protein